MIVGAGLVARAFAPLYADDPDTLIFASGVSNSSETDPQAFLRERSLLQRYLAGGFQRVMYFGSCNVVNPRQDSAYFQHKRAMEALVAAHPCGTVLRLPQVVGRTRNPNTLTNFLRDRILAGQPLTVWTGACRNLIDIDDVVRIAARLLAAPDTVPSIVSIASPWSLPMREIVALFESAMGRHAHVIEVDRGETMQIDTRLAEQVAADIGLDFGPDYPLRVIHKYYGPQP